MKNGINQYHPLVSRPEGEPKVTLGVVDMGLWVYKACMAAPGILSGVGGGGPSPQLNDSV